MKIENQVCSLELAKKLKELGVKQESLFGWTQTHTWKSGEFKKDSKPYLQYKGSFDYSAFTVAELGEMLPKGFFTAKGKKWRSWFSDTDNPFEWGQAEEYDCIDRENEVDARAEMLIYLLENKLITI